MTKLSDGRFVRDVYVAGNDYELVAAGQTAQMLGATGAVGDLLSRLVIVPATTAPGVVQIKDGNATAVTVYTGGTVGADLTPILVELGVRAVVTTTPGWQITTGNNVSVFAVGDFT